MIHSDQRVERQVQCLHGHRAQILSTICRRPRRTRRKPFENPSKHMPHQTRPRSNEQNYEKEKVYQYLEFHHQVPEEVQGEFTTIFNEYQNLIFVDMAPAQYPQPRLCITIMGHERTLQRRQCIMVMDREQSLLPLPSATGHIQGHHHQVHSSILDLRLHLLPHRTETFT
jgi:hypothetical protein